MSDRPSETSARSRPRAELAQFDADEVSVWALLSGRVVRSEEHRAAVRIDRYEFKTRKNTGLAAGAGESSFC